MADLPILGSLSFMPGMSGASISPDAAAQADSGQAELERLLASLEMNPTPAKPAHVGVARRIFGALGDALTAAGRIRAGGMPPESGAFASTVAARQQAYEDAAAQAADANRDMQNRIRIGVFQGQQQQRAADQKAREATQAAEVQRAAAHLERLGDADAADARITQRQTDARNAEELNRLHDKAAGLGIDMPPGSTVQELRSALARKGADTQAQIALSRKLLNDGRAMTNDRKTAVAKAAAKSGLTTAQMMAQITTHYNKLVANNVPRTTVFTETGQQEILDWTQSPMTAQEVWDQAFSEVEAEVSRLTGTPAAPTAPAAKPKGLTPEQVERLRKAFGG